MTRELILGMLFSAAIHLLLLFGDGLLPERTMKAKPAEEPESDILRLVPPPPLEEEPEIIETGDFEKEPLDLAPPMQPDLPQPVQPDSFVQRVQPPPPEGLTISTTMTIVPETRDPGLFRNMKVFDPSMLDQTPVPKYQARPHYPPEMRRTGISGEVVVDFIVDPNGEVQNVHALRSTQREFESAAIEAVSKWKFRPGRKDGRNVPTHMQVPIVFTLNEQ